MPINKKRSFVFLGKRAMPPKVKPSKFKEDQLKRIKDANRSVDKLSMDVYRLILRKRGKEKQLIELKEHKGRAVQITTLYTRKMFESMIDIRSAAEKHTRVYSEMVDVISDLFIDTKEYSEQLMDQRVKLAGKGSFTNITMMTKIYNNFLKKSGGDFSKLQSSIDVISSTFVREYLSLHKYAKSTESYMADSFRDSSKKAIASMAKEAKDVIKDANGAIKNLRSLRSVYASPPKTGFDIDAYKAQQRYSALHKPKDTYKKLSSKGFKEQLGVFWLHTYFKKGETPYDRPAYKPKTETSTVGEELGELHIDEKAIRKQAIEARERRIKNYNMKRKKGYTGDKLGTPPQDLDYYINIYRKQAIDAYNIKRNKSLESSVKKYSVPLSERYKETVMLQMEYRDEITKAKSFGMVAAINESRRQSQSFLLMKHLSELKQGKSWYQKKFGITKPFKLEMFRGPNIPTKGRYHIAGSNALATRIEVSDINDPEANIQKQYEQEPYKSEAFRRYGYTPQEEYAISMYRESLMRDTAPKISFGDRSRDSLFGRIKSSIGSKVVSMLPERRFRERDKKERRERRRRIAIKSKLSMDRMSEGRSFTPAIQKLSTKLGEKKMVGISAGKEIAMKSAMSAMRFGNTIIQAGALGIGHGYNKVKDKYNEWKEKKGFESNKDVAKSLGFGILIGAGKGMLSAFTTIYKAMNPLSIIMEPLQEILAALGEIVGTAFIPLLQEVLGILFSENMMEALNSLVGSIGIIVGIVVNSGLFDLLMKIVVFALNFIADILRDEGFKKALSMLIEALMLIVKEVFVVLEPFMEALVPVLSIFIKVLMAIILMIVSVFKFLIWFGEVLFFTIVGIFITIINAVIAFINLFIPDEKDIGYLSMPHLDSQGVIEETGYAVLHGGEIVVKGETINEIFKEVMFNNDDYGMYDRDRNLYERSVQMCTIRRRR